VKRSLPTIAAPKTSASERRQSALPAWVRLETTPRDGFHSLKTECQGPLVAILTGAISILIGAPTLG